jgi:hypothetical protein
MEKPAETGTAARKLDRIESRRSVSPDRLVSRSRQVADWLMWHHWNLLVRGVKPRSLPGDEMEIGWRKIELGLPAEAKHDTCGGHAVAAHPKLLPAIDRETLPVSFPGCRGHAGTIPMPAKVRNGKTGSTGRFQ